MAVSLVFNAAATAAVAGLTGTPAGPGNPTLTAQAGERWVEVWDIIDTDPTNVDTITLSLPVDTAVTDWGEDGVLAGINDPATFTAWGTLTATNTGPPVPNGPDQSIASGWTGSGVTTWTPPPLTATWTATPHTPTSLILFVVHDNANTTDPITIGPPTITTTHTATPTPAFYRPGVNRYPPTATRNTEPNTGSRPPFKR